MLSASLDTIAMRSQIWFTCCKALRYTKLITEFARHSRRRYYFQQTMRNNESDDTFLKIQEPFRSEILTTRCYSNWMNSPINNLYHFPLLTSDNDFPRLSKKTAIRTCASKFIHDGPEMFSSAVKTVSTPISWMVSCPCSQRLLPSPIENFICFIFEISTRNTNSWKPSSPLQIFITKLLLGRTRLLRWNVFPLRQLFWISIKKNMCFQL